MTLKSQSNTSMQNPVVNVPNSTSGSSNYRPSVPITVYRQLGAELQSTQAKLDSLKIQNQQLTQQNQQLRQEIDKLLHSAWDIQHILTSIDGSSNSKADFSELEVSHQSQPQFFQEPIPSSSPLPPVAASQPSYLPDSPIKAPEQIMVEEKESKSRRPPQPESSSDVSGWLLILAIILIVLTAFSMGFLIVRPLLNDSDR